MSIQYQLSNSEWVNATPEQNARMVAGVLEREEWFAPRVGRTPMTTPEQVLAGLEAGQVFRHGDDWYQNIRIEPGPLPALKSDLVRCDCGHECERTLAMSASRGSACPDCYDRMSD